MANLNYCLSDDTFSPWRSENLQLKTVTEPWERRQYFALRRAVFADEQKIFTGEERDSADFRAVAIIALSTNCAMAEDVIGAVRIFPANDIHEDDDKTWVGGRLCVARAYRGHRHLGMALVNEAVCRARDLGCTRFVANIQPQNERYFQRLHWHRIGEVDVHGRRHVRMQARLDCYPFMARQRSDT